jgi:DNA anti-recombination protein RmuC
MKSEQQPQARPARSRLRLVLGGACLATAVAAVPLLAQPQERIALVAASLVASLLLLLLPAGRRSSRSPERAPRQRRAVRPGRRRRHQQLDDRLRLLHEQLEAQDGRFAESLQALRQAQAHSEKRLSRLEEQLNQLQRAQQDQLAALRQTQGQQHHNLARLSHTISRHTAAVDQLSHTLESDESATPESAPQATQVVASASPGDAGT